MLIGNQIISLSGLRFYAFHGVDPQETVVGGWYSVDVDIETDSQLAVRSDDLNGTVNYALIADVIKRQMQIRSALLEHVAGRIAQSLLDSFAGILKLTVTVRKEHPPVGMPCRDAGFTLIVTK